MSTIKANTIQNLSGVEKYLLAAWVNFNGTGTVAIRASGNVSSITDNGVGDWTVNFTTALSDANYCVLPVGNYTEATGVGANGRPIQPKTYATTSVRLIVTDGVSGVDMERVNVAVVR